MPRGSSSTSLENNVFALMEIPPTLKLGPFSRPLFFGPTTRMKSKIYFKIAQYKILWPSYPLTNFILKSKIMIVKYIFS